jgi:general nucleoside transport system ATP-binding protein
MTRLVMKNISKSFASFKANDDVSLSLARGEIHALLGENGAGKSTLVKVLYGLHQPDTGEIWLDGKRITIKSPREARKLGIGMVFQHFSLFEGMTVFENIALGLDESDDNTRLKAKITDILAQYSLPLDLDLPVHSLSVGEKQRIEIVRCLLQNPQILILDEPTSVLTPQEVESLFALLRALRDKGCSILYISHKLPEIKALCDKATILRLGKKVIELDPRETDMGKLAEYMIGAEVKTISNQANRAFGEAVLSMNNFTLHKGEMLCIAGVAGNGQNELMEALSGEVLTTGIHYKGREIGHLNPTERRKLGISIVPEERNGHAAVPEMSLYENTLLTARDTKNIVQKGLINWQKARDFANNIIKTFDVRTRSNATLARSLSGGNLQKYIIGREILQEPEVLIISQPTWGVDAGAANDIRQKLLDLLDIGVAILVISQDLDELLEMGDTIAVLHLGELSTPVPLSKITRAEIGLIMGGAHV